MVSTARNNVLKRELSDLVARTVSSDLINSGYNKPWEDNDIEALCELYKGDVTVKLSDIDLEIYQLSNMSAQECKNRYGNNIDDVIINLKEKSKKYKNIHEDLSQALKKSNNPRLSNEQKKDMKKYFINDIGGQIKNIINETKARKTIDSDNFVKIYNHENSEKDDQRIQIADKYGIDLALMQESFIPGSPGDLYDLFEIDKDNVGLIIGDVKGKGQLASNYGAQLVGALQSMKIMSAVDLKDTTKVMDHLNNVMCAIADDDSFTTAAYFVFNKNSQELKYCVAGQEFAIKDNNKTEVISIPATPLGIIENIVYVENKYKINQGDIVFAYTDGLYEQKGKQDKVSTVDSTEIQTKIIPENVAKYSNGTSEENLNNILQETVKNKIVDDITLMYLKFK